MVSLSFCLAGPRIKCPGFDEDVEV